MKFNWEDLANNVAFLTLGVVILLFLGYVVGSHQLADVDSIANDVFRYLYKNPDSDIWTTIFTLGRIDTLALSLTAIGASVAVFAILSFVSLKSNMEDAAEKVFERSESRRILDKELESLAARMKLLEDLDIFNNKNKAISTDTKDTKVKNKDEVLSKDSEERIESDEIDNEDSDNT